VGEVRREVDAALRGLADVVAQMTNLLALVTAPPPQSVQDLVVSVRYPKSGQGTKGDPLGREGAIGAH